jgi:hypothetical protein
VTPIRLDEEPELIRNLLAKQAAPPMMARSCGGRLGQYGIYEQVNPSETVEPCYAVIQLGKPVHYLKEHEHNGRLFKPYVKLPWQLPSQPDKYENERQLWEDIRTCLHQHLDLASGNYEILASWVMSTWILEKWKSVPYLFFFGSHATGKTRALEILSTLSFRGWLALYVSPANLYRPLETWSPTLFLDEAEVYGDTKEILALLNGSYRRGQLVPRQVETANGYETQFFDCFGFKALAGTKKLAKTLESRCIKFKMSSATRKVNLFVNEEQTLKLKNQLLTWRFHKLCEEGEANEASKSRGVSYLADKLQSGRLTELIYPIYVTTPTDQTKAVILQQALSIQEERLGEMGISEEVIVLDSIVECYRSGQIRDGQILISRIADEINRTLPFKEQWKNKRVSSIAQRVGFQKKRRRDGTTIIWNRKLIERLKHDPRYRSCFENFETTPSPDASFPSQSSPKTDEWIDRAFKKKGR